MNIRELQNSLIAFTDGSSLGNPGPGGWGVILIYSKLDEVVELGGMKPRTTNNEMELEAVVATLTYARDNSDTLHIFSDSQYLVNGATKWIYGWAKNGWKTKQGDEIKNLFHWKTIYSLIQGRGKDNIIWHHLSAHVGIAGNERADEIARSLAEGKNVSLYRGHLKDYPIKNILSFDFDEEKKEKRSGKGKMAYSYLSLVDGELQRHSNWAECEARVKGKKAKFKKAVSKEHEDEILKEWGLKKEE